MPKGRRPQASPSSRVVLSNRQYATLKMFTESTRTTVGLFDALEISQTQMNSMWHRGYIDFDGQKFHATDAGRQAILDFEGASPYNAHSSHRFGHLMRSINILSGKFTAAQIQSRQLQIVKKKVAAA